MLNEPDPGPTLLASSRAEQGDWRKEARIPHSALPTFPPLFPLFGGFPGMGSVGHRGRRLHLVPTLPPDPKRDWSRCLLPGPRVSLPMKQGDESGSALRLLSTLLLCGSRTITILASPGHPSLSLEAGKDARCEQPSQGWLQILSWRGHPLPPTKGNPWIQKKAKPTHVRFSGREERRLGFLQSLLVQTQSNKRYKHFLQNRKLGERA